MTFVGNFRIGSRFHILKDKRESNGRGRVHFALTLILNLSCNIFIVFYMTNFICAYSRFMRINI